MLLWLPGIFSIKDVLYNQPIIDPLRDPDQEFLTCESGTKPQVSGYLEHHSREDTSEEDLMHKSIYNSFPKTTGKVIIEKSRGEVSLIGQDTIENVS